MKPGTGAPHRTEPQSIEFSGEIRYTGRNSTVLPDPIPLRGDTDTVGAVTGGLAGIIYGLDDPGGQWFDRLRNREAILDCLW